MADVAATIAMGGRRPIPTLLAHQRPAFVHVTSRARRRRGAADDGRGRRVRDRHRRGDPGRHRRRQDGHRRARRHRTPTTRTPAHRRTPTRGSSATRRSGTRGSSSARCSHRRALAPRRRRRRSGRCSRRRSRHTSERRFARAVAPAAGRWRQRRGGGASGGAVAPAAGAVAAAVGRLSAQLWRAIGLVNGGREGAGGVGSERGARKAAWRDNLGGGGEPWRAKHTPRAQHATPRYSPRNWRAMHHRNTAIALIPPPLPNTEPGTPRRPRARSDRKL